MTKDEALKLALDALEGFIPYLPLKDEAQCNSYDKAITALRLAIDEQNMASKSTYKEQLETKDEPVGKFAKFTDGIWKEVTDYSAGIPLYTTLQRTWVGLTNGEMIELSEMQLGSWDLILEVEATLKDKNI